jgi:hypothetical protein
MVLVTSAITAVGFFEVPAYRYGAETRPDFDEHVQRGPRRSV